MCILTMKPTVSDKNTYLGIVADSNEKLILKILDVYGKMATTIQTQIEGSMHELIVNISDLKVGVYVVNAFSVTGSFLKAIKFHKTN